MKPVIVPTLCKMLIINVCLAQFVAGLLGILSLPISVVEHNILCCCWEGDETTNYKPVVSSYFLPLRLYSHPSRIEAIELTRLPTL